MIYTIKYFREHGSGTVYKDLNNIKLLHELEDDFYQYYNDINLIEKFRTFFHPQGTPFSEHENLEFLLTCFYLYHNGYSIDELPNLLSFPRSIEDASDVVRLEVYNSDPDRFENKVPWSDRRRFAAKMTIRKSMQGTINVSDDLKSLIAKISSKNLSKIDLEHKVSYIRSLNEGIEHLLKQGNQYETVDEGVFLGLITNEDIKKYRKITHDFRHGTKQSLKSRESLEPRYDFLIRYGVTILEELLKIY